MVPLFCCALCSTLQATWLTQCLWINDLRHIKWGLWCGRGDSNSHFQRKPDFAYQLRLSPPSLAEKSTRAVCGLDFLITVPLLKKLRWMPSSLYTFPKFCIAPLWAWLGISNTATRKPSPNLTSSLVQFPITRTHNWVWRVYQFRHARTVFYLLHIVWI